MEPDKQPSRRMMDMGPRRSMDMGPRRPRTIEPPQADPAPVRAERPAARPVAQPLARPQTPQSRPATPQHRPQAPQPAARQSGRPTHHMPAAADMDQSFVEPKKEAKTGGWRTVLQVIIGLIVIAAVASAIVVLYIKYYQ